MISFFPMLEESSYTILGESSSPVQGIDTAHLFGANICMQGRLTAKRNG